MSQEKHNVVHKEEYRFQKICFKCGVQYGSNGRSAKFCSEDCCKAYWKMKKHRRKEYTKIREIEMVRVQSHIVSKQVLELLAKSGLREKKCECCPSVVLVTPDLTQWKNRPVDDPLDDAAYCVGLELPACGGELEVHHISGDYLDNRPENLLWVCKVHHAFLQSFLHQKETSDVCPKKVMISVPAADRIWDPEKMKDLVG